MKKRIVSLLLCCIMIFSIASALASVMPGRSIIYLKSSKSDSFYALPDWLFYNEDTELEVWHDPGRQLDDVPLIRGQKLIIPAKYEGLISVSYGGKLKEESISADQGMVGLYFVVRPASGPKLSAKIVDKKTIEVTWSKPFDDVEEFAEIYGESVNYTLNVYDADTGDRITWATYSTGHHARSKGSYAYPEMTATSASIPLKGRTYNCEKYQIKEGANLKLEFRVTLGDYERVASIGANGGSQQYAIEYTSSTTTLSVPVTPVIFKPVTNFCIGRKLDKRNAVGKTVKLVRGVKEKFRIFGVQPSDATEPQFVWTSSKPNVVSVTEDGIITAKKLGTAIIKVKAVNTDVVKSFKIQVVRPADKK